MEKIQITQILVQNAILSANRLDASDSEVVNRINETKQKQAEVLKLREVDFESLRMVVQL